MTPSTLPRFNRLPSEESPAPELFTEPLYIHLHRRKYRLRKSSLQEEVPEFHS